MNYNKNKRKKSTPWGINGYFTEKEAWEIFRIKAKYGLNDNTFVRLAILKVIRVEKEKENK